MIEFRTTHQGLAALLKYAAIPHIRTEKENGERGIRAVFVFADPDRQAAELHREFFSPEGISVSDARLLLLAEFEIRKTIANAFADGIWKSDS